MQSAGTIGSGAQIGVLGPRELRKLFERLGATYIKLGQVRVILESFFGDFYPSSSLNHALEVIFLRQK